MRDARYVVPQKKLTIARAMRALLLEELFMAERDSAAKVRLSFETKQIQIW
jgi:hypothetical protein